MPYPNEHASRQKAPGGYERIRRQNNKFGPGIDVIWGVKEDGTTEVQSIRFDAKKFTPAEAKKWLKDNDYKVVLEPAEVPVSSSFHQVTMNLRLKARKETMEGRDFVVAPVVMLTKGVHAGSLGPMFYGDDELKASVRLWDHKPIVLQHPTVGNKPVSACDSGVIDEQKVGVLLGTSYKDGKLKSEAWLEVDRLDLIAPDVLKALKKGMTIEVSTGLYGNHAEEEGEWNGEPFQWVAHGIQPDHLALLPGRKGACSIEDGCGLLRNTDVCEILRASSNEQSHQDKWNALDLEVKKKHGDEAWIQDVFESFVVYRGDGKLFRQEYGIKDEVPSLVGLSEEVNRATKYYLVRDGTLINKEKNVVKKKEEVKDSEKEKEVVKNEEDSETKPESKVDNQPEPKEEKKDAPKETKGSLFNTDDSVETVLPKGGSPVSTEEYIANAPPPIREVLSAGMSALQRDKTKLIAAITANKANILSEEQLAGKSLEELTALAALAESGNPKKTPSYTGQGEVADDAIVNVEEPLVHPEYEFASP